MYIHFLNLSPAGLKPILKFNLYDDLYDVDRRSCMGAYKVVNGLPVCPANKTNITGRGNLFYWGPNHYILALFTKLVVLEKKFLNHFL